MNKRNTIQTAAYISVLAAAVIFAALLFFLLRPAGGERQTGDVVIAVPRSDFVQDYDTNYYTKWLEEKTGYNIDFVFFDEGYENESLNSILASDDSGIDGCFFPSDREIISLEEYISLAKSGRLASPADCLPDDSRLAHLAESYPDVDFEKLKTDGTLYCFPYIYMARTAVNKQIMWINTSWLSNLGLAMPRTTDELYSVLKAFKENDPNKNGKADELPLVSCEADDPLRSYLYLLNSFVYYDNYRLSLYAENGRAVCGAASDKFREGLRYCARLFSEGLLIGDTFGYTAKQLAELVNDPSDVVGAFCGHSIADVVYTNNPGVLAHFVQLDPLSSDAAEQGYAVTVGVTPSVGGIIPANAAHKNEAAKIMELMLSDEASLIALYGEENTDWRFSRDGELSTYGQRAKITTVRYLKGERQNQNYAGAGPLLASGEYTDGVTWNGDHSMTEYIDARAVKSYESYYLKMTQADRQALDNALNAVSETEKERVRRLLEIQVPRFIKGEIDIDDDGDWKDFVLSVAVTAER